MDRVNVRQRHLKKQNEATLLFTTAPCEMEEDERISVLFLFKSWSLHDEMISVRCGLLVE